MLHFPRLCRIAPQMSEQAKARVSRVLQNPAFASAAATLAAEHERTISEIIALTETPAPPFQEQVRAAKWFEMAEALGLQDMEIDAEGNVTGIRRGAGNGKLICVAAHLDTVFPAGTDVTVRREGTRLLAPGVGDDTRSLAVLLAWLRALDAAKIATRHDILFVADVGEEGAGDLRGMRYLFTQGRYKDRISAFLTVDSPEMDRIVTGGVGSKRYRVTFHGPGGHSFGAFGIVNPMFAMADAIARLGRVKVPTAPRTTYSASVTGGGTSINAIPNAVWTEFDLRSESAAQLAILEQKFFALLAEAVAAENATRSVVSGSVTYTVTPIGDRPAGQTAQDCELVQLAKAAIEAHGFPTQFEFSSTDANIPMSLCIPAIRIGSGGRSGRAHALDEWIDVEPTHSIRGMTAGLATLLAVADMI
jgi:tripeptide aminopeptidase